MTLNREKKLPQLPSILATEDDLFDPAELSPLLDNTVLALSDEEFERLFEENTKT